MYLHIGADRLLAEKEVVGIFDLDNTTTSALTREYLRKAQTAGQVTTVSQELPKSFAVTAELPRHRRRRGAQRVFLAQMAPGTLLKRSGDMSWAETESIPDK